MALPNLCRCASLADGLANPLSFRTLTGTPEYDPDPLGAYVLSVILPFPPAFIMAETIFGSTGCLMISRISPAAPPR